MEPSATFTHHPIWSLSLPHNLGFMIPFSEGSRAGMSPLVPITTM